MKKICLIILGTVIACNNFTKTEKVSQPGRKTNSVKIITENDAGFVTFWSKFRTIINDRDIKSFRNLSLNKIRREGKEIAIDAFINTYFEKVFDPALITKMSNIESLTFSNTHIQKDFFNSDLQKELLIINDGVRIKGVNVTKSIDENQEFEIVCLQFVETKKGFKFFECFTVGP